MKNRIRKPVLNDLGICWDKLKEVDLVPRTRLELVLLAELPPQSSVSTNFTTWATENIIANFATL